jgi:hypothetical protein
MILALHGAFGILGMALLIASFTGNTNCKVTEITGVYSQKIRGSSRGVSRTFYYIGKTLVNIPSAWTSSLENKKEYTVEIYRNRKGFLVFTPIVLTVSGLAENSNGFSLSKMKYEENKIVKEVLKSFLFYFLIIGLPFFLIFVFFKLATDGDRFINFLNNHPDIIMIFIEYITTHSVAGNLAAVIFKYGYIFIILISVFIATLLRAKKTGKVSKIREEELLSMSLNTWLRDYSNFMEHEFKFVMKRSVTNDSSVIMDYRKTMERYKQLQGEFKLYKKSLNSTEKSLFIQEFRIINKRL